MNKLKVIKRNGWEETFDTQKIVNAVVKANADVEEADKLNNARIEKIANTVEALCAKLDHVPTVDEISDMVEIETMKNGGYEVAQKYIRYRHQRDLARKANSTDEEILTLIELENQEVKEENSNKNPTIASTQRDYMAGSVSKDITKRLLLSPDIVKAHEEGIIHFHDADYFAQHIHNCCVWNLEDMLQNGTVISNTMIEKPHSFYTACNITTQLVAQVASCQYGGQTFSLAHLAPFVDISRQKLREDVRAERELVGESLDEDIVNKIAEKRLKKEIASGIQTIQYQLVTLMTTNGQAPFVSVFMHIDEVPEGQIREDLVMIIEEVLNQRIKGVKNEKGVWVTTAFPKLLYVLDEDNIYPESKYWYLTELAAKCTAKRMTPDYISAKIMRELKNGDVYGCMGCRSFLTTDRFTDVGVGNIAKAKNYQEGKHKYYGRFNQGVVTINLADVALSSGGDFNKFWKIFDERLNLCYKALKYRHNRLRGTVSDVAPILWQHGALARLEKGETIDKLLYDGYSTISLGYAALYECVKYMTGVSHTDEKGKPFALAVMQKMNDKCAEWKAKHNIDFSPYGTPIESVTYKFAKALAKRFPEEWRKLSGKNYITNSYHVHVTEPIDAFTKLKFEAEFQQLSPGGAISYVEVPNMQHNIPAVLSVIQFIYDNIMYAELNTKSDYCMECGYDGEIQIIDDEKTGRLEWECPNCHNRDQRKMSVARRTCGYIGTNYWNQGRTQEIRERVLHL